MNSTSRVFVAGGDTLLGAALLTRLRELGFERLVGAPPNEPDLTCPAQVEDFFGEHAPEYVFLAGGASGGIGLNASRPADLALNNLLVLTTVLPAAFASGVRRLLYFGSSCGYPRLASQPMAVEALGAGPLEPTSAPYAAAKLAGVHLCEAYRRQYGRDFVTAVPANAFGPHDDFREEAGHVVAALIRRLDAARRGGLPEVAVWGSGQPRREFVYSADVADAAVFVMRHPHAPSPINLGGGRDVSIAELASLIAEAVGYRGRLVFDDSKPDGAPLKRLDSSPLFALGWRPRWGLRDALAETCTWYLQHVVKEDPVDARATVPLAVPDPAARGGGRPGLPD